MYGPEVIPVMEVMTIGELLVKCEMTSQYEKSTYSFNF